MNFNSLCREVEKEASKEKLKQFVEPEHIYVGPGITFTAEELTVFIKEPSQQLMRNEKANTNQRIDVDVSEVTKLDVASAKVIY
jgi:hypothetical protein